MKIEIERKEPVREIVALWDETTGELIRRQSSTNRLISFSEEIVETYAYTSNGLGYVWAFNKHLTPIYKGDAVTLKLQF